MFPVIITGGPGAGKTTLIKALSDRGFTTFQESSRDLIEQQSQLKDGILPWENMSGFAALCFEVMKQQKSKASEHSIAFLDRAIPDICGYLKGAGIESDKQYLLESKGYFCKVFVCCPHQDIYVQDEIRPYPFEEALDIHYRLVDIYQQFGYCCIEVPFKTVNERVEFVLNNISTT